MCRHLYDGYDCVNMMCPSLLDKATHPTNRQEDWEYIIGFCDQINKELEGPQIAVTLLVHKIHSPQEWEALQALTVLEACMKNCGRRFHNEVGKYRFLNELIKVVSPKYLGETAPEKVKVKIVEMLYSWTVAFPSETKIGEAYQTLRRQGLVTNDPELPLDRTLIPSPPTRPKHPVFDNEDMGKLLAELLRSKNPEDLQEANRLIKNMVKEDDARVQKVTKRIHTLEEVNINVKLLTEMLTHYNKDSSTDSDKEIIKELYERCDKLRRAAFKMATETEDNDTSLGLLDFLSSQMTARGSSFGIPAAAPAFIPGQGSPSSASLLQSSMPGSPALSQAKAQALGSAPGSPLFRSLSPCHPPLQGSPARASDVSLSSVHVLLEAIRPSKKILPVTAYDKDGIRVLFNFASDCPPGRPDVLVMVVSMLNTAPLPVHSVVLQAAVPKSMKVKLQPPSGTELAPFNPILPPASITQIMLLANPSKEKVRLRYKLAFTLGDRLCNEVGEVDQFPAPESWGRL
uniref:Golgi associated, gamma adaptin ear containing, ARF binding protein 3b n=1 Tax=Amphiprion ocellaris TaxID=80972 RepID=A0AAQ6ADR6_AMPOC